MFWTAFKGNQNFSVVLSQVMNHGFLLPPQDKTPKSVVAHCKLSLSQQSKNEQIQKQIDAHFFFYDSQRIVDKEFVPPGQNINQTFYGKSLEDSRKWWHMCDQALHALGCCTTTMPHVTRQSPSMNFWQKKKKHSCCPSAPLFAGSQSL